MHKLLALAALLAACTDEADVLTTVAHVQVSATCMTGDCPLYSEMFTSYCGTDSSTAITPTTREVTVISNYTADTLVGYLQLQYANDLGEAARHDELFNEDRSAEIYTAYAYELLYRLAPTGEVTDVDTSRVTIVDAQTLEVRYAADGAEVQEHHTIEDSRPVHVEIESPGIMDACCTAARPHDAGLLVFALGAGLARRRRRRYFDRTSEKPR